MSDVIQYIQYYVGPYGAKIFVILMLCAGIFVAAKIGSFVVKLLTIAALLLVGYIFISKFFLV